MPKTSRSLFSASALRLSAPAGLGHVGLASASSSRTVPSMALPPLPSPAPLCLPRAAFITGCRERLEANLRWSNQEGKES